MATVSGNTATANAKIILELSGNTVKLGGVTVKFSGITVKLSGDTDSRRQHNSVERNHYHNELRQRALVIAANSAVQLLYSALSPVAVAGTADRQRNAITVASAGVWLVRGRDR